jgi:hypothetical protein
MPDAHWISGHAVRAVPVSVHAHPGAANAVAVALKCPGAGMDSGPRGHTRPVGTGPFGGMFAAGAACQSATRRARIRERLGRTGAPAALGSWEAAARALQVCSWQSQSPQGGARPGQRPDTALPLHT